MKSFFYFLFIFIFINSYAQEYDGFGALKEKKTSISNFRIAQNTSTLPGYPLHYNTVRALNEINIQSRSDAYPWISSDGLRLYYTKSISNRLDGTIYYTSRPTIESDFNTPQPIIEPNTITSNLVFSAFLSDDELNLYFIDGNKYIGNLFSILYHATRISTSDNFSNLQMVTLTGIEGKLFGISFSPDFTKLYLRNNYRFLNDIGTRIVSCIKTAENKYALQEIMPKTMPFRPGPGQVTQDGFRFYFSLEDSTKYTSLDYFLAVSKRNNLSDVFSELYYIDDTLINNKNYFNAMPTITPSENIFVFTRGTTNNWLANDLWIAYNSTSSGQYLASVSVVGAGVLSVGGMEAYSAVVLPMQNSSNAGTNWSVGPPELASISGNGQLVALSAGVVTVTATAFSCCTTLTGTMVLTILGSPTQTCVGSNCQTFVGSCLGGNCQTTIGIACKSSLARAVFSYSFNKDTLLLTMQTNPNLLKIYEWVVGGIVFKIKNPVQYIPNPTDTLVAVQLSIIDNANCTDTLSLTIKIQTQKPTLAGFNIANVFTPNGDGYNDEWQPLTEKATNYLLQVYNRYGVLVFESTNWNQAWNGSTAPDGLYFYHMSYQDTNKIQKHSKGWVEVLR